MIKEKEGKKKNFVTLGGRKEVVERGNHITSKSGGQRIVYWFIECLE